MTLITDLEAAGILTQEDAKALHQSFKSNKLTSFQKLNLLYQHFAGKIHINHQSGSGGFSLIINVGTSSGLTDREESKSYLELLQLLLDHGLISNNVHQKLYSKPFKGDKYGYLAGLYSALNLTRFYNEFTVEKQLEFAKILAGKDRFERDGMLDSRKKKRLIRDINNGKLNTYFDFFEYCHSCHLIDIKQYLNKPDKLLKNIIKPLNAIIFDAFTIIAIDFTKEPFQGNPSYHDAKAAISINTGDQIHHHEYTLKEAGTNTAYTLKEVLTNLLTAINQLLAAYNRLYRLTGITNSADDNTFHKDEKNFAICLINPDTAHIFDFYDMQRRFLFNQPMIANFRLPLSYKNIQYALYHFSKSGLLSHISNTQSKLITDHLYTGIYVNVGDLLKLFPNTIITVERTVTKGHKPYRDFLFSLDNISRGVLNITDVIDNTPEYYDTEDETTFDITFSCNGTFHRVEFGASYGEFNDRIIFYIINEIIRKDYKDHQLLQLIHNDHQRDIYLFASNERIYYLTKMKLIESIDRF
ncbi:hypothetical protein LJ707_15900 [Mucilaginibacter sp. UR6-1]|uniref:hypothetical protein n=1 Tax=Mucilaginibacter sp. UR6-1 TaxID=1435643 RepID=UPI001E3C2153|nr:hypothetical protein [Mucilaginibacter sp. UR6-1]MCC8410426.1 hypothetical protein [Mucilaginibacter sp. UR6-1]